MDGLMDVVLIFTLKGAVIFGAFVGMWLVVSLVVTNYREEKRQRDNLTKVRANFSKRREPTTTGVIL